MAAPQSYQPYPQPAEGLALLIGITAASFVVVFLALLLFSLLPLLAR